MCDPSTAKPILSPAEKLAKLIQSEMDVSMNAKVLRLFLRANWTEVTRLAHLIHGRDES